MYEIALYTFVRKKSEIFLRPLYKKLHRELIFLSQTVKFVVRKAERFVARYQLLTKEKGG